MFTCKRTVLTAAVLSAALLATLTAPSFADKKDDLHQQKKENSSELADAKKALDASTKEFAQAAASLKRAQVKLDAARSTLGQTQGRLATAQELDLEMQRRLERSQADLKRARADLTRGERRLKSSEDAVEEFAVQSFLQGDPGLRAFSGLVSGGDPQDFTEEISMNAAVSDSQTATMQRLDATRVILTLNREKVQKLRDKVKVQRKEAAANLVEKKRLEAAAAEQNRQVTKLVSNRRGAQAVARQAQVEDERMVRAREAESARLNARLAALARQQVKTGGKSSGGDGGGSLSYPVNGPITSPYGMRVHPVTGVYKLHDGTDFGVACGTPIRAAASGTIIEQYFNGAYGNRVIINHGVKRGVNVVTTYNHLSGYAASAGSRVNRGQVIGYVGSTGYSTGCHLHFMVLVNGATTQPMNWL
ncbi:MAG: hypothetical protein JWP31_157 [Aeromicrobium sp.]|nr:hypothetical protein [Aeromicrobium sp.]